MLALNSTEAERNRGICFSELFESPTHVAKNRGTAFGTIAINFGATIGAAVGYVRYPSGGLLNKPGLSFVLEFIPFWAGNDGLDHVFLDSTAGSRIILYHLNNNTIYWYTDVGALTIVASNFLTYGSYWKQNQRNVLCYTSFNTGTSAMFLNGVQIGTGVQAWTVADPALMYLGSDNVGAAVFNGKMLSVKVFSHRSVGELLTLREAKDYFDAG